MGILTSDIPEGYIAGLSRRRVRRDHNGDVQYTVSHLYKGTFDEIGQPMCKSGYEAEGDISIWRGNIGPKGLCSVCLRRARAGLAPAPWPEDMEVAAT
jgi:hypothetical protein